MPAPGKGVDLFFFFDKLGLLLLVRRGYIPMYKNAGFTLIELLVVVLIIGILSAVALPQYTKAVEKARAVQAVSVLRSVRDAQEVYYMANGAYADSLDLLDIKAPDNASLKYFRWDPGLNYGRFALRRVNSTEYDYFIIFSGDARRDNPEFASLFYCAALPSDAKSAAICKSIGRRYLGTTDYVRYVLE